MILWEGDKNMQIKKLLKKSILKINLYIKLLL
jgi:hypothetical protein